MVVICFSVVLNDRLGLQQVVKQSAILLTLLQTLFIPTIMPEDTEKLAFMFAALSGLPEKFGALASLSSLFDIAAVQVGKPRFGQVVGVLSNAVSQYQNLEICAEQCLRIAQYVFLLLNNFTTQPQNQNATSRCLFRQEIEDCDFGRVRAAIVAIARSELKKEFKKMPGAGEALSDESLQEVLSAADELRIDNESVRCVRFAMDYEEQRKEDLESLPMRETLGKRSGTSPEVWWSTSSSVSALL